MDRRASDIAARGGVRKTSLGRPLTSREREVLTALARGETGDEVATRLVIAPETVRRHVANAREKLGARTRVHAIAIAIHYGQIDPHFAPDETQPFRRFAVVSD